jgi:hypothetical protein
MWNRNAGWINCGGGTNTSLSKANAKYVAVAYFVTENSANNFPALPVREGEQVLVSFMRFQDQDAYERHLAALFQSQQWCSKISNELTRRLKRAPEILKLSPTARSLLRG